MSNGVTKYCLLLLLLPLIIFCLHLYMTFSDFYSFTMAAELCGDFYMFVPPNIYYECKVHGIETTH